MDYLNLLDKDWNKRAWKTRINKLDLIHLLIAGYNSHELGHKRFGEVIDISKARRTYPR